MGYPPRDWNSTRRNTERARFAIASTPVRPTEALPRDARIVLGVMLLAALAVGQCAFTPQLKGIRKAEIEQERWKRPTPCGDAGRMVGR